RAEEGRRLRRDPRSFLRRRRAPGRDRSHRARSLARRQRPAGTPPAGDRRRREQDRTDPFDPAERAALRPRHRRDHRAGPRQRSSGTRARQQQERQETPALKPHTQGREKARMYDKEKDLFAAFAAKKMSRREMLDRAGQLGLSIGAAAVLLNAAATHALAADFDWQKFKGTKLKLLLNKHPYADAMIADLENF